MKSQLSYSAGNETMNAEDILNVVHDKQRKALKAMIRIYGGDVDAILNALHEMSARIAIATGVEPESFAEGVKHHWGHIADAINAEAKTRLS